MFYWKSSSGGSETLDGLSNMSKAEILRGIVTEKLSTAAQEILAVVERTVAGYEEEASGFRREISRQKRQLELLLQPRVRLERKARSQEVEVGEHEVVVLSEEEEEEQQNSQQTGVDDSGGLGLLWYDEYDDEEADGGDEGQRPETSFRRRREDLKDPDYQIKPRLMSPRGRSDRRRPGRPRISDAQNHLDLRIYILEDSHTDVLSKRVFQKCPVQELQVPRGLQEPDFLDLLRSTFPQLAAQEPFDFFTSDRTKRLQPLRLKTLTPEEIHRSIRRSGAGNSALYIRLKTGAPQSSSADLHPPHGPADSPCSGATTSADRTQTFSRLSTPGDSSERRRRGRPRLGEEPTHHVLRVCVLEDSQSNVLSRDAVLRSSIQELRCPRGQQEADFLDQLRSAFPQLAGDDKPLDLYKSDRSRRLQRLRVATLTPDEISRTMKPIRVDKTLLYIRLKSGEEEEEEEEEELHLQQRDDEAAAVQIKTDDGLDSSPVRHADAVASSSTSRHQETEEDEDAARSRVDSSDDDDKDLDEDDDWKPDPEQLSARTKRKRGAKMSATEGKVVVSSKTPCRVCGVSYRILGSLIKHAWSHVEEPQSVCGVCGQRFECSVWRCVVRAAPACRARPGSSEFVRGRASGRG